MSTTTKTKNEKAPTTDTKTAKQGEACAAPARSAEPRHGSVVHVEIQVPEFEPAVKFFSEVFGWEIHPFTPDEMYFMTPGNWGPCGCLVKGEPAKNGRPQIYINCDDMNATIAKIEKKGIEIVQKKTEIPGNHGYVGQFRTPCGNTFGLYSRS